MTPKVLYVEGQFQSGVLTFQRLTYVFNFDIFEVRSGIEVRHCIDVYLLPCQLLLRT